MDSKKKHEEIQENTNVSRETKKEQKTSVSYTLKSMKRNIEIISCENLITQEEYNKLNEIWSNAINKMIKKEYGL